MILSPLSHVRSNCTTLRGVKRRHVAILASATVAVAGVGLVLALPSGHGVFIAPPVTSPLTVLTSGFGLRATNVSAPNVLVPSGVSTWSFLVTPTSPVPPVSASLALTTASALAPYVTVGVATCTATSGNTCASAPVTLGTYSLLAAAQPIELGTVTSRTLVLVELSLDPSTPQSAEGAALPVTATVNGVAS